MLVSVEQLPDGLGLNISSSEPLQWFCAAGWRVAMELDEEVVPARQIKARLQYGLVGGAGKSRETGLRLRTNQFRNPAELGL